MKKHSVYLALAIFILLSFSTCNFEIPERVLVKGSPSITLSSREGYDFGSDLISELMKSLDFGEDSPLKIYECTHNSLTAYTMLVVLELPEIEDFDILSSFQGNSYLDSIPDGTTVKASDLINNSDGGGLVFPSFDTSMFNFEDFDFNNLMGDLPFQLDSNKIKTKLFISGHPIIDLLSVDVGGEPAPGSLGAPAWGSSLNETEKKYSANGLPANGIPITLPFDAGFSGFNIDIGIDGDADISKEVILAPPEPVKTVLAVWFPLELKVKSMTSSEPGYPYLSFEVFNFYEEDEETGLVPDLLNREEEGYIMKLDGIDVSIESVSLSVTLSALPFSGIFLVDQGTGTEYKKFVDIGFNKNSNKISVTVNMKNIEDTWPFAPKISILLEQGSSISIPRELKVTRLEFSAKISALVDLAGFAGIGSQNE